MDERRTKLANYYKEVHLCRVCKQKYGSDIKEETYERVCHECEFKFFRGTDEKQRNTHRLEDTQREARK